MDFLQLAQFDFLNAAIAASATTSGLGSDSSAVAGDLRALLFFLLFSFIDCVLLGFVTLALGQLILPSYQLFILRHRFEAWGRTSGARLNFPQWLKSALGRAKIRGVEKAMAEIGKKFAEPLQGDWDWAASGYADPAEVRRAAQAALEQPLSNPALFARLTESASPDDRGVVLLLDFLGREDPESIARFLRPTRTVGEPPGTDRRSGLSAAVTAAQQAIATAAERALGALPERGNGWTSQRIFEHTVYMGLGASLAWVAGKFIDFRPLEYVVVLGMLGGLLASYVSGLIESLRDRTT